VFYCAVRTGSLNQIFTNEAESVYCAVRTGSLNQIFTNEAESVLLRSTDWVFISDFYK